MKCTIKKIYRNDKNQKGQPYVGKNGPFTRITLLLEQLPDEKVYGFANDLNAEWKDGDMIDIDITEKKGKDNKLYKNFKNLSQKSSRLDEIEARLTALEGNTEPIDKSNVRDIGNNISTEEIPF